MAKPKFVHGKISDFGETKGYFIGQFMEERGSPELKTDNVEITWRKVLPREKSELHYHKIGTEINITLSGGYTIQVDGKTQKIKAREFLVIYPGTKAKILEVEEGTEAIVVKAPSVPGDKYGV